MSCRNESNILTFRVGFPTKDAQGNAIDVPEGIQLEVQVPGAADFVVAGQCVFPQDTIQWTPGLDGMYIFRAVCFLYKAKGGGCGALKRFGPASQNIGVTIKDARPGAPPSPVQLVDTCCTGGMGGMAAPSLCMA